MKPLNETIRELSPEKRLGCVFHMAAHDTYIENLPEYNSCRTNIRYVLDNLDSILNEPLNRLQSELLDIPNKLTLASALHTLCSSKYRSRLPLDDIAFEDSKVFKPTHLLDFPTQILVTYMNNYTILRYKKSSYPSKTNQFETPEELALIQRICKTYIINLVSCMYDTDEMAYLVSQYKTAKGNPAMPQENLNYTQLLDNGFEHVHSILVENSIPWVDNERVKIFQDIINEATESYLPYKIQRNGNFYYIPK